MALKQTIQQDVKDSLKKGDKQTALTLRSLLAEVGKKEIDLGKKEEGLSDEELQKLVLAEIKKRKEAQEQYAKAGRGELAEAEQQEAKILQKYAPEKISQDKLNALIDDIIKSSGASSMADMGTVIKQTMTKAGSGADGSQVSAIVKEKLQNQ